MTQKKRRERIEGNVMIPIMPEWIKKPLRTLRDVVVTLPYYGNSRYCPVCGKSSRMFRQFGVVLRDDAQCVYCGAVERHRLLWLFLQKKTDLFDGRQKKMLHVAPESCFVQHLKKHLGDDYLTADLFDPNAMVKMDITDIQYADQSFDVIYCSHVLEHVPDDKKAMREFFRVLKKTGWAILLVPIQREQTIEDLSISGPEERLKAYGLEDHVRQYGPDYVDRLREAGFTVDVFSVSDMANPDEAKKMGLTQASGDIYYCTK